MFGSHLTSRRIGHAGAKYAVLQPMQNHREHSQPTSWSANCPALPVDKMPVSILLCSNLRERKVRRDVVIDVTPLLWSRDLR